MGRKRNQGKARKAANAKAREEVEEMGNNNQTTNGTGLSLAVQIQLLRAVTKCMHGIRSPMLLLCTKDIQTFVLSLVAFTSVWSFWLETLGLSLSRGSLVS